jgi:hypothetical protein
MLKSGNEQINFPENEQMKIDHYPDPVLKAVLEAINHEIGAIFNSPPDELKANFDRCYAHYTKLCKNAAELISRLRAIYPPTTKEQAELKAEVENKLKEIYIEQCKYAIKITAIVCILDKSKYASKYQFLKPYFEQKNLDKSYENFEAAEPETIPF